MLTDSGRSVVDAMESALVNLAAAVFGVVTVKERCRAPADDDHPTTCLGRNYFSSSFGHPHHRRVPGFSGRGAASMNPQPLEQVGLGLALSVASSALNGGKRLMLRSRGRIARRALEADANIAHGRMDVGRRHPWHRGCLTGWLWLDPVVAMGVALNIGIKEGNYHLIWRSARADG